MFQLSFKLMTTMTMELAYYSVPFMKFVFLFKSIQIGVKNDLCSQTVLTKIWRGLMSPPESHPNNLPFWNGKLLCQEEMPD
jgi:hypothetical protein